MNKKKKSNLITLAILLTITIIIILALTLKADSNQTDKELAECIKNKAILYTQLGCHACIIQENMFGENYQYLNVVDCFYTPIECLGVDATPTWKINSELYRGVQSIEKLKELTGC